MSDNSATTADNASSQQVCPVAHRSVEALSTAYDPYTDPQLNNPFPVWARARSSEPVFYSKTLDAWIVTQHGLVQSILQDTSTFKSSGLDAMREHPPEIKAILKEIHNQAAPLRAIDDPDHARRRRLTMGAVTPKRVAQLDGKIRTIANQLIDGFYQRGRCDFYDAFAYRFPLAVACSFLGFSDEETEKLHNWATCRVMLAWGNMNLDQYREVARGVVEMSKFVENEIISRQNSPRDDVISDMIRVNRDLPQPSSLPELVEDVHTLIVAGHESTATFLTLTLFHLLETGKWPWLCANRNYIAPMLEESLRFDGPVLGLWRIAARDTRLGDISIPAGQRLYVSIGSANRDEAVFREPARFNAERSDARSHIAFGRGPHTCIGAPLARHESRAAFEILTERFPKIRLAQAAVCFSPNAVLRLPKALMVEWDA